MVNQTTLLALIGVLLAGSQAAHGQCTNQAINWAFQTAFGRAPAATECDPNRFAGGTYGADNSRLVNYVRASAVCQDPWIAQAFYDLGRNLNGHSPLALDSYNGSQRPYSTMDDCNRTNYNGARGGWTSYAELKTNIAQHFSPAANPAAAAPPATATITGPATLTSGQPATVSWTYSGTPTNCGSGVYVQLNGANWGPAARLTDRAVNIDARLTNFAYPAGSRVTLSLFDACLGRTISPNFTAAIGGAPTLNITPGRNDFTVPAVVNGRAVTLNRAVLFDNQGYLIDSSGIRLGSGFHLGPGGALVSTNGGNVVGPGGASVIAAGGGNAIAAGGGNVIAAGGGNMQPQTTRAYQATSWSATGSQTAQTPFSMSLTSPDMVTQTGRFSVSWTHTGNPPAALAQPNCGVNVMLTVNGSTSTLAAHVSPALPGVYLNGVTRASPAGTPGTLTLKDACTGASLATRRITLR